MPKLLVVLLVLLLLRLTIGHLVRARSCSGQGWLQILLPIVLLLLLLTVWLL